MPNKEVSYIAEQFNIDTEKGIALNNSLKENLFTSFVCIVNRIPLIIVGKPGEGKSLTVQTINQTMKGIYSKSPLFKEYPQIFMYNYQGSETSTSQAIIETFEKARKYAKKIISQNEKEKKDCISMIFFDEMGLAERSPNNPLKAIHKQLEYDDNETKISFIGISNWKIDASKMNRCLTLSKPDPDKEDLIYTGNIISKALDNSLGCKYEYFIYSLTEAYYEYQSFLNKDNINGNFHGNRDFYHLIKYAMRELIKYKKEIKENNKDRILTKIGLKALARNFGGLSDSFNNIKLEFRKSFKNFDEDEDRSFNYNILECIKDNLNDYNSRFLMLVANSTIVKYLENILKTEKRRYIFLTGSVFKNDKKAAQKGGGYSEDLLNKIQFQITKDDILILKDLEIIYPSLYELFNQNYTKIGKKYYTKITFANSKSSSEIHNNLRIILLITQNQLDNMKVDPPFLNRFEKQIVRFSDLLNENQKILSQKVSESLEKIRTFNNYDKLQENSDENDDPFLNSSNKLSYNLPELMINCSNDEIQGLIYKIYINTNNMKNKENNKFIENEIYKIIVPTFCEDIIASIQFSGFASSENILTAEKIINIYKEKKNRKFR